MVEMVEMVGIKSLVRAVNQICYFSRFFREGEKVINEEKHCRFELYSLTPILKNL